MPPKQLDIRPVPDHSFACKSTRRRFKKQNHRNLAQLLLVTSELGADVVAQLADQERQRVSAARAACPDRAIVPACADCDQLRTGEPSPVCTQPVVASAENASASASASPQSPLELARKTLQESRKQSAVVRRLLSRSPELAPRRQPTPPDPSFDLSAGPPLAPGPRTAALLVREYAKIRRAVAALAATHPEPFPRPRPPSPPGGSAARASSDLADLFLPDGTSVAQALAAKDAHIAQLRFEIADRNGRQLANSISRAAAFVRNPSNQLAVPPPSQAPSQPGGRPGFDLAPPPPPES
jgi:hypothetical protein